MTYINDGAKADNFSTETAKVMLDSRKKFIVLGLCGKTGSGTTTSANILEKDFSKMNLQAANGNNSKIEKIEDEIICTYAEKNWHKFHKIKTSSLITATLFNQKADIEENIKLFKEYLENTFEIEISNKVDTAINKLFNAKIKYNSNTYFTEDFIDKQADWPGIFTSDTEVFDRSAKPDKSPVKSEPYLFMDSDNEYEYNDYVFTFTLKDVQNTFDSYCQKAKYKETFKNPLIYFLLYHYIFIDLPKLTGEFWKRFNESTGLSTVILQDLGNNIRISGNPYKGEAKCFKSDCFWAISEKINRSIKLLGKFFVTKDIIISKFENSIKKNIANEGHTMVVIDSIKNPFESMYLKDRYTNYYLIAIYTDEEERMKRLRDIKKLENKVIREIDIIEQLSAFKKLSNYKENDDKLKRIYDKMECFKLNLPFIMQNVESCIEQADIFIYNKHDESPYNRLNKILVRYVCLITNPGLLLPTDLERCMQVAYTAKLNSGCVSRQVGAVITDKNYNIISIGWNQVPPNQIPCTYRNLIDLYNNANSEFYSSYENDSQGEFRKYINDAMTNYYCTSKCKIDKWGRKLVFCFKDIYNDMKKERNQIYPRSLHAEETAFLNIGKYNEKFVEDGYLFTTSSPCELCSKKALYMGISKIYYVEPYPGISSQHILSSSSKIILELFTGAVGRAYMQLYMPILPKKDELQLLLGHKATINDIPGNN